MRAVLEEKRSIVNSPGGFRWRASGLAERPIRILRLDFPRGRGLRCFSCNVPKWWNWQTRHLEGVVGRPVRVQIPPSAPSFAPHRKRIAGISELRMASHPERRMPSVAPNAVIFPGMGEGGHFLSSGDLNASPPPHSRTKHAPWGTPLRTSWGQRPGRPV